MTDKINTPRIIFMGTPEFAVASLDALVQAGYPVVGVITAPDKQAGRGMKLTESAVKKYAVENGLYILQPEKLKNPAFLEELRGLQADLQVVVAFRMLPELVWNMPPMGTINVHGSLLPQYRGAAPINWAVINGEKETGITTFKLQHEIDTGNILLQTTLPIHEDETAGGLHDRMKEAGAALLVKTIQELAGGTLQDTPQKAPLQAPGSEPAPLKHAPKIFTEDCRLNWNASISDVYNRIRGLSPHPAAFTLLNGRIFKVHRAEKMFVQPRIAPGEYETDGKTFMRFACTDGYILLREVQPEGKKRMPVEDFLRGFRM